MKTETNPEGTEGVEGMQATRVVQIAQGSQLVSDLDLFRLATRMRDSLQHGTPVYRRQLLALRARDLYPGGRLMQIQQESVAFTMEINFRRVRHGSYAVMGIVIEEKRPV